MAKHKILACLVTLSALAATPAAIAQNASDYAAIVAAPDRSDAIASSTPTARRRSGWRSSARSPA